MPRKYQTWVGITGEMEAPLAEAMRTFETDKPSRAVEAAVRDWYNNRRANSKSESLAKIIAVTTQMDARLAAVEATLRDLLRVREGGK